MNGHIKILDESNKIKIIKRTVADALGDTEKK